MIYPGDRERITKETRVYTAGVSKQIHSHCIGHYSQQFVSCELCYGISWTGTLCVLGTGCPTGTNNNQPHASHIPTIPHISLAKHNFSYVCISNTRRK